MNVVITAPYKESFAMPSVCCVCGSFPAPHAKTVTLLQGMPGEVTVWTQLPVCIHCQRSTEAATNTNVRAILAGFGGFLLSFVVVGVFGAIFRALNLGEAGTTLGMVIAAVCMVGLPILFARPFLAKRDPDAIKVRAQYEQVKGRSVIADKKIKDVILEVPSQVFATAFVEMNGGTAVEGTLVLGFVVPANKVT